MTTDEIRALVAEKIAGQGNQVDAGGGLAAILNAICDKLDTVPSPYTLPAATAETLGGVKVGDGLKATADGTLALKGTVITETLSGSPREISGERYTEITQSSPILLYDGKIYLVSDNPDLAGAAYEDTPYTIFISYLGMNGSVIDSFEAIICYFDAGNNAYFIKTLDQ